MTSLQPILKNYGGWTFKSQWDMRAPMKELVITYVGVDVAFRLNKKWIFNDLKKKTSIG